MDKTCIHQMFGGQEIGLGKVGMDGVDLRFIGGARGRGSNVRNEPGLVHIAGFGQEDFVANPGP